MSRVDGTRSHCGGSSKRVGKKRHLSRCCTTYQREGLCSHHHHRRRHRRRCYRCRCRSPSRSLASHSPPAGATSDLSEMAHGNRAGGRLTRAGWKMQHSSSPHNLSDSSLEIKLRWGECCALAVTAQSHATRAFRQGGRDGSGGGGTMRQSCPAGKRDAVGRCGGERHTLGLLLPGVLVDLHGVGGPGHPRRRLAGRLGRAPQPQHGTGRGGLGDHDRGLRGRRLRLHRAPRDRRAWETSASRQRSASSAAGTPRLHVSVPRPCGDEGTD